MKEEHVQSTIIRPYFDIIVNHRENNKDDLDVIKEMFSENVYALEGYHFKQLNPVVVDIGASIGTFTMLALKISQESNRPITVYAVEPEPHNLELFEKNMNDNPRLFENGSQVIVVKKAISDFHGVSMITNDAGSSRLSNDGQQVDVITLDEFFDEYGINKVDFMKIDIEGSEVPLIRGASDQALLKSHFYAIEFDQFNEPSEFLETLRPFLHDFSFRTWGIPANGCNLYLENHEWQR